MDKGHNLRNLLSLNNCPPSALRSDFSDSDDFVNDFGNDLDADSDFQAIQPDDYAIRRGDIPLVSDLDEGKMLTKKKLSVLNFILNFNQ